MLQFYFKIKHLVLEPIIASALLYWFCIGELWKKLGLYASVYREKNRVNWVFQLGDFLGDFAI